MKPNKSKGVELCATQTMENLKIDKTKLGRGAQ